MKLVRYGPSGSERPGALDSEMRIRDLSGVIQDVDGRFLGDKEIDRLRGVKLEDLPIVAAERLGPCVANSSKFVCVGLNYADHAREGNRPVPSEPVLFLKAPSSIAGPNDDIEMPAGSAKTDWEVELGVVIGTRAKAVGRTAVRQHIAGYCVIDDLSERAFQSERGGQWTKGKSLDTYGPIGPWLVTRDEVPDPNSLSIWHEVDNIRYQDSSTADMIFQVDELVSYVSQFMTLLPGDIVATGTPAGVGLGQRPEPVYLKSGQKLRLGIDGLGIQEHSVVAVEY